MRETEFSEMDETSADMGGTPQCLQIGDPAPNFQARTTMGMVNLSDFRGRWLILFSHPADFTPVCTSEFVALSKASDRFEALNCALLAVSVDSLYSHLGWIRAIRDGFGVTVSFPIVEDPSLIIGRAYGMISDRSPDAATMRSTYFIDPDGIIRGKGSQLLIGLANELDQEPENAVAQDERATQQPRSATRAGETE